jgi:hypothetical protein
MNPGPMTGKQYTFLFGICLKYDGLFDDLPVVQASLNPLISVAALLDSGAGISVLTDDFAPVVGIPSVQSGIQDVWRGLGSEVNGYIHDNIKMELAGKPICCPVLFVPEHTLSVRGIPLILGRECVFRQLGPVMFHETQKDKYIYIE